MSEETTLATQMRNIATTTAVKLAEEQIHHRFFVDEGWYFFELSEADYPRGEELMQEVRDEDREIRDELTEAHTYHLRAHFAYVLEEHMLTLDNVTAFLEAQHPLSAEQVEALLMPALIQKVDSIHSVPYNDRVLMMVWSLDIGFGQMVSAHIEANPEQDKQELLKVCLVEYYKHTLLTLGKQACEKIATEVVIKGMVKAKDSLSQDDNGELMAKFLQATQTLMGVPLTEVVFDTEIN